MNYIFGVDAKKGVEALQMTQKTIIKGGKYKIKLEGSVPLTPYPKKS
jgi:hypothetical protein